MHLVQLIYERHNLATQYTAEYPLFTHDCGADLELQFAVSPQNHKRASYHILLVCKIKIQSSMCSAYFFWTIVRSKNHKFKPS
jgi:hypothetical protein